MLLQAGGNRTKAAELMGVSRRTLHRKLVRWPELDTETKKASQIGRKWLLGLDSNQRPSD